MRIKVITKENGEYTSDVISDVDYSDALDAIDMVTKGQAENLSFSYAGGKVFFTPELLKTSVFFVMKD